MHWTYEAFESGADLLQGDILEPTRQLRSVLDRVHPHFLDPKYLAFLLITQSCDMAVRKGGCSTKFLNIAVVRPLESVLHDFLQHVCRPVVEGVYLQETKGEARRLLERLFNQNEQSLGLFYLHPDREAGIDISSVSLLRVTVTLRVEHYDVLRQARRGRLCSEFRSKLGWLVGNLYSRIGTEDWSDPPERNKEMEALVKKYLETGDDELKPVWVPGRWVSAAKEKGIQVESLGRKEASSVLEANRPPEAKAQAIDQAIRVLREVLPVISEETVSRIRNRLNNDPLFARALRAARLE
jgi:hypothetical protein